MIEYTELGNLEELTHEIRAARAALMALEELRGEVVPWASQLPERWLGTSWSTDGLDAVISAIPETTVSLELPVTRLLEQLALVDGELQEARAFGGVVGSAGANGDVARHRRPTRDSQQRSGCWSGDRSQRRPGPA